jgi:hypothetical protein
LPQLAQFLNQFDLRRHTAKQILNVHRVRKAGKQKISFPATILDKGKFRRDKDVSRACPEPFVPTGIDTAPPDCSRGVRCEVQATTKPMHGVNSLGT